MLLLIALSMAFLEATWRFSDLDKLVSVLDFVIGGLEESVRDVIEFLVIEDTRMSVLDGGASRMALNGLYFKYFLRINNTILVPQSSEHSNELQNPWKVAQKVTVKRVIR